MLKVSVRHTALEYDPAWDEVSRGPVCEFIADIVWKTSVTGSFSLWLIDYRIKRNSRYREPTAEGQTKDGLGDRPPKIFYASDRRFVELGNQQIGNWAGHSRMWDAGYELSDEDPCFFVNGADGFVQAVRDKLDDRWNYEEHYWYDGMDVDWVAYGLLACEPL